MQHHLIKRADLGYRVQPGWRCEVKVKHNPSGSRSEEGDCVYVAENGYAIFASSTLTRRKPIARVRGLEEFVRYALKETDVQDDAYWMGKMRSYAHRKGDFEICIFEYYLDEIVQFDRVVPLEGRFLSQAAWYYLDGELDIEASQEHLVLTQHIPTRLREEVYHRYKLVSTDHVIDVDHFVPASIGGAGNVFENLVPISASINRRKSNRVPSRLFEVGRRFGYSVPADVQVAHDSFAGRQHLALAARIVSRMHEEPEEEVRRSYREVRDFHFPYLRDMA